MELICRIGYKYSCFVQKSSDCEWWNARARGNPREGARETIATHSFSSSVQFYIRTWWIRICGTAGKYASKSMNHRGDTHEPIHTGTSPLGLIPRSKLVFHSRGRVGGLRKRPASRKHAIQINECRRGRRISKMIPIESNYRIILENMK